MARKLMKFKLLVGLHTQNEVIPPDKIKALEEQVKKEYLDLHGVMNNGFHDYRYYRMQQLRERHYRAGDGQVVVSDINLVDRFGNDKFERLPDDAPLHLEPSGGGVAVAEAEEATYDAMSVKELQNLAVEEGVDLKGAKTKEEMIKIFKNLR